jgi:methionyl aminopeptidase
MIYFKTPEEIELIRESCLLVSRTLSLVAEHIRPGVTGLYLDKIAETFIRDHNAVPGFKGYNGFPATLCISVNEQVVHGIPSDREVQEDDILSVDCGVLKNEFYGDSAYTFVMRGVGQDVVKLCEVTNESLYKGIEKAVVGNRLGDVSNAIQRYTEVENKYSVVRELVGHGIGKNLHESPEVPNYGKRGRGPVLKKGIVIAIEPMINLGKKDIKQQDDGWTIVTKDGLPSAHYEHTIAISNGTADILSNHEIVIENVKNNDNLQVISIKK